MARAESTEARLITQPTLRSMPAGIDLSVGWVMSLASVLSALAIRDSYNIGAPVWLAVILGLLAGTLGAAVVGFINGVIIAKLKVPAFIVTLGSSFIVRAASRCCGPRTPR